MSNKKLGHKVKALKNLIHHLEGTGLIKSSLNYVRLFISITSKPGLNLSHVGSKTRSQDQVIKNGVNFREHSFDFG